jgi:oligogalacturonide lyase
MHKSSMHFQQVHPHPRFTAEGKQVLYTSDRSAYGNLYLVDVPEDVGSLPLIPE